MHITGTAQSAHSGHPVVIHEPSWNNHKGWRVIIHVNDPCAPCEDAIVRYLEDRYPEPVRYWDVIRALEPNCRRRTPFLHAATRLGRARKIVRKADGTIRLRENVAQELVRPPKTGEWEVRL